MQTDNTIPRRSRLDLLSTGERAVYDAVQAVEGMGADPLLTDAVVLLQQARDKIADFVDGRRACTDCGRMAAGSYCDCCRRDRDAGAHLYD
jgi:hypothetical protein